MYKIAIIYQNNTLNLNISFFMEIESFIQHIIDQHSNLSALIFRHCGLFQKKHFAMYKQTYLCLGMYSVRIILSRCKPALNTWINKYYWLSKMLITHVYALHLHMYYAVYALYQHLRY